MKTIGMLGGMSWESTSSYYRFVNEGIKQRLGGLHSARICLYSVDFDEIEQLQHAGDWAATADILSQAGKRVQAGGADFLVICTNTMHKVALEVEAAIDIPLLHIADATAAELSKDGIGKVGLLGTRFTMEQDFYKGRVQERFGIEVVVPDSQRQQEIHRVIYEELCLGNIEQASRQYYLDTIDALASQGAEAVILGCTEIAMLVAQQDTKVPLYDTTAIHCQAAVELALSD
jgi:aspartate racemase